MPGCWSPPAAVQDDPVRAAAGGLGYRHLSASRLVVVVVDDLEEVLVLVRKDILPCSCIGRCSRSHRRCSSALWCGRWGADNVHILAGLVVGLLVLAFSFARWISAVPPSPTWILS